MTILLLFSNIAKLSYFSHILYQCRNESFFFFPKTAVLCRIKIQKLFFVRKKKTAKNRILPRNSKILENV